MINRGSLLMCKVFQPLQLLGCYYRFYICVHRDEEPEKFSFDANYRNANGKKAIAYYQVVDVTNVERYNFCTGHSGCAVLRQRKVSIQYFQQVILNALAGKQQTHIILSPVPREIYRNDPPMVTSNVRSVSQPRQ